MYIHFSPICHIYYYPLSSFMLLIHLTHRAASLPGFRKSGTCMYITQWTQQNRKMQAKPGRLQTPGKKKKKVRNWQHIADLTEHLQFVRIRLLHEPAKDRKAGGNCTSIYEVPTHCWTPIRSHLASAVLGPRRRQRWTHNRVKETHREGTGKWYTINWL